MPIPTPEFIQPKDISVMTDAEFDSLLERIRESRLRAYQAYMEAEKQKQLIRDEKLRDKLAQQTRMLDKEIIRADKVIVALEKRINNIRVIQLDLNELPEN